MVLHDGPIIRSKFPRPGSLAGNQKRREFLHDLLTICGDVRLLWAPGVADTTTTTDASRNARVITYDATIAARFGLVGSLPTVDFDGTDDEADTPDVDALSFGNGVVDEPFSVGVLVKPDVHEVASFIAKEGSATAEEWKLGMLADGDPVLILTDESASATIARSHSVSVGLAWHLLVATYDGSGAVAGINLYKDGLAVDDTDQSGGTYTAMENTAALVHIGARYTTKAQFLDGSMALVFVCAKALSQDENWAIKELVNGVADLTL